MAFFVNNDMITIDRHWRDGIHFQDIGENILSRNFYQVLNNFLFEGHYWLQNLNETNEFVFDLYLKGLSELKTDFHVPENVCQIKIFPSFVRKITIICSFGVQK